VPVALLFDLDETLVLEEPAAVAAFAATARCAPGIDVARLAVDARAHARALWYAAPTHPYCRRIGISSWEGLWCRFDGDEDAVRELREWAPAYRREAWARALADQGAHDSALATELGERFGTERRARHETFADVPAALDALAAHPMALVTNGAACLQREKLAASGLEGRFGAVVVSGDVGVGKPAAAPVCPRSPRSRRCRPCCDAAASPPRSAARQGVAVREPRAAGAHVARRAHRRVRWAVVAGVRQQLRHEHEQDDLAGGGCVRPRAPARA
jgi:putative hydrolase of the HAD superfamily